MKQVSVYTANKKGAMYRLTRALADAKVDIRALVTNDSAEFGTIRMIVDHPEVAIDALTAAGCCCSLLLSMNCSNSLPANCSKCCPIMLGQAAGA